MSGPLQLFSELVVRRTRARHRSSAERSLAAPEHAWTLVADASLWSLWMPGVASLLEPARPLRRGLRLRVAVRPAGGRLGLGAAREGHVQVDGLADDVLAWTLIAGGRVEVYRLQRSGGRYRLEVEGGDHADAVLAGLDRETTPIG